MYSGYVLGGCRMLLLLIHKLHGCWYDMIQWMKSIYMTCGMILRFCHIDEITLMCYNGKYNIARLKIMLG